MTFAISICSLVIAHRADRTARSDRDEREAARVSAWISFVFDSTEPENKALWNDVLVIRNAADSVIHNVEAKAVMNGADEIAFTAKICPPGESYSEWIYPRNRPHQNRAWKLPSSCSELAWDDRMLRPFPVADKWSLVSMSFTDALGKRWEYEAGSGLRPI
ncbi:hypothetical protein ACRQ4B_09080 [Curtobacterium sp. SP.BCo]|uniref:hypothetical protein n=1 Tax=Curtobacterium sp. SP.BCo TaxID=3435229 RepID=UPI003F741DAE